jgi:hypothetical protein
VIKKMIMLVCSTLLMILAVLLCDLVLSSSILDDPDDARPYLRLDSGWYELKRNHLGIDQWGDRIYRVRTDSQGFRTNDRVAMDGNGEVLFLGDSFTYGINGPWDETFVGMYANFSNRPTLNAGIPSYSPTPYLFQYEGVIRSRQVMTQHVVILGLDISDVADEAIRWRPGKTHPIDITWSEQSKSGRFFRSHLILTRTIWRSIRNRLATREKATPSQIFDTPHASFTWADWNAIDSAFAPLGVGGGIGRIEEVVTKIAALAKDNGGSLYLLAYPHPAQLAHESMSFDWEGFVDSLCVSTECSGVINAFPAFRSLVASESDWYHKYFVDGDAHYNAAGNRVVFNEIVKRLEQPDRGTR